MQERLTASHRKPSCLQPVLVGYVVLTALCPIRILEDANGCTRFSLGRAPNFVLLDWVNVGQGKQAVDRLNGF